MLKDRSDRGSNEEDLDAPRDRPLGLQEENAVLREEIRKLRRGKGTKIDLEFSRQCLLWLLERR